MFQKKLHFKGFCTKPKSTIIIHAIIKMDSRTKLTHDNSVNLRIVPYQKRYRTQRHTFQARLYTI